MTIIGFIIDSSASMNQRAFIGARPTLLDMAKGAVENFVKFRQRNPESRFDRYMLFTSEEAPMHIKAGWKENLGTFMNELKNIRAVGLTTLGPAIKNVFDLLNINRVQSGIDTYGSGRSPFFIEPALIICITDGGKLSSLQGVQDDIFPLGKSNPIPGAELTKEIFRWDQRLFGLVLRLTGTPSSDALGLVPSDSCPLDKLCEQTGGRTYAVRTHRMFQQCIESLVQKVQSGVVINFEKIGPDPAPVSDMPREPPDTEMEVNGDNLLSDKISICNGPVSATAWYQCRKMIYVTRPPHRTNHGCFWPIPESYWPDMNLLALPARSAHPNVKFTCISQEPMAIDNLPFDKYELEPSLLTQYILSRKQPNICWQVFISNSSKNNEVGHPFGYLKSSTTKPSVNLFVMPYNYPVLLPLLDDLFKTHRGKPTKDWRQQFELYLRSMPTYYITPLKRALERMTTTSLIPDKYDSSFSYQVVNNLKKLKNQAKQEYEKICSEVEKRVNQNMANPSVPVPSVAPEGLRVLSRARPLPRHLTSNHLLQDKFVRLRDSMNEHGNFSVAVHVNETQPQAYRNPFDIRRCQLVDQLTRMRANFLQGSSVQIYTEKGPDQLHCKPINQMGNYQDYLKKVNPPLRELESAPVRQHMFGNPFKIDKKMSMMVDEADVDFAQAGQSPPNRSVKRSATDAQMYPPNKGPKRRKGPLPPEFSLEHFHSTSHSPNASFTSSPSSLTTTSTVVLTSSPLSTTLSLSTSSLTYSTTPASYSPPPLPRYPDYPHLSLVQEDTLLNGLNHQQIYNGGSTPPFSPTKGNGESDAESEFESDVECGKRPPLADIPSGSPNMKVEPQGKPGRVPEQETQNPKVMVDLAQIRKSNGQLVLSCYKEIKKTGRDFSRLIGFLQQFEGTIEVKTSAIEKIRHEAARFKRHSVIDLLDKQLVVLQSDSVCDVALTNGITT